METTGNNSDNKDISFSELKGYEPFDWNKTLAQPFKDFGHYREALFKARGWVTCACGSQCAALPRDEWNQPKDYVLRKLGAKFYSDIVILERGQDPSKARETLKEIEERSAYLLTLPDFTDPNFPYEKFKEM